MTVYNGASVVPWCLRSAARAAAQSASTACDVLVLDDASPEPGFSEHVADLCAGLDIQYYRTPRNLGIPRNVNVGLLRAVHAGYDYVLIANLDVLFGAHTVDRMVDVIAADEKIGSVTAWSNNVSIYSLPNDDPDKNLADQEFVDWIGDVTAGEFGRSAVDIPAGISFCILIPTEVIRSVGLMDPVFGRGYCEETDWTLRSQQLGYRIVLAPSAFVYHQGQGSNRAAGIIASGHTSVPAYERIIDLRYPLFREQVQGFYNFGDPRSDVQQRASIDHDHRGAGSGATGSKSVWPRGLTSPSPALVSGSNGWPGRSTPWRSSRDFAWNFLSQATTRGPSSRSSNSLDETRMSCTRRPQRNGKRIGCRRPTGRFRRPIRDWLPDPCLSRHGGVSELAPHDLAVA